MESEKNNDNIEKEIKEDYDKKEEEKINEIKINEKQNKEVLKENDTCLEEGKITEKIFNDEKIDVNETLFDKD